MIMRHIILLFLLSFSSSYSIFGSNNQDNSSGFAKICFVDKNGDHSRTYLGKLTKGDLPSLKYELQNNFAEPVVTFDDKSKSESAGYVDRITAKKLNKKWKKNRKKANNDLFGNYEVEDEESLEKVREKKLQQREERESENSISGNKNQYTEKNSNRSPNSYLSKHYRVSGRRINDGQTFKRRAGYVCLIVKYKIREGNIVSTYINVVEDYLKEGSKYNLKYHGTGSNRKYYLEFVSAPR